LTGQLLTQTNQDSIFIREDFHDLEDWRPLTFPKIDSHSRYEVIQTNGQSYLQAVTDSSASGIIFKNTFDVYQYPLVEWKWQVSNIFEKGNAKTKAGDDYPLRIYIVFKYDPVKADLFEKAKYNAAKLIYGEYPPYSSLNYIWANQSHPEKIITNTYTSQAKMIVLRTGSAQVNQWLTEKIDILADYEAAFGENPPRIASIAIMSDADNTGEAATGLLDYIKVYRKN